MRYSKPTSADVVLYSTVKLQGCTDSVLGFTFLAEQPQVGRRRYCNKVLVHECLAVDEPDPLDLSKVEFIATDDPCYTTFDIFKSSETIEEIPPSIEIQRNDDNLAIGVLITFSKTDVCCLPLSMHYRMYGYLNDSDDRVMLSNGNLYVTPCSCTEVTDAPFTGGVTWTGVTW